MSVSEEPATHAPVDGEPEERSPAFQRFMESIGQFWTFGVLVVLVLIFGAFAPDLYSKQAWLSTSEFAVEYLILAIGQTFVIVTAGIDLSDGALLGFSAMVSAKLMENMMGSGGGGTATVIIGILVMLGTEQRSESLNGLLITRVKLPPFIVTLGTLTAFTGATDLVNNGTEITNIPTFIDNGIGSTSILGGWLPIPVLVALAVAVVFGLSR